MPVTVNTDSLTGLTTLAVVKTELEITSTDDDAFIDTLIDQASDLCVMHTGRTFHRQTVTETLPGSGTPLLVLNRLPIVSITSATNNGSTVSSTAYSVDDADAGILFKNDGWKRATLSLFHVERHPTAEGKRDWSIQYAAGYVTPEEAASTGSTLARTLPFDLERACVDTVKSLYLRRGEDSRIKKQAVDATAETINNNTPLPPSAMRMLERWRSIGI